MAQTTVDLYRRGNASSPRLTHVRLGKDVRTIQIEETEWVVAGSGGVSTFSEIGGGNNWWLLPAGYDYAEYLVVVNDHGNHYSWEPVEDMALARYVDGLAAAEAAFRKVS